MLDVIKVVRACAIGGLVTVLAAIAVAPVLTWWLAVLALLAGFSGGYLSWEFREAIYAVPVVWKSLKKDLVQLSQPFIRGYNKMVEFLKDGPHPFFWELILVMIPLTAVNFFISRDIAVKYDGGFVSMVIFAMVSFTLSVMFIFYSFLIGYIITAVGASACNADWLTTLKEGKEEKRRKWKEVLLWQVIGIVLFIPYTLWKVVGLFWLFLKKYFILIHSRERLLCGFDGLLGGLVFAVWVWSDPAMPAVQKALMVGCGAMLGGMFGFISYQFISIKWLKLVLVPKS